MPLEGKKKTLLLGKLGVFFFLVGMPEIDAPWLLKNQTNWGARGRGNQFFLFWQCFLAEINPNYPKFGACWTHFCANRAAERPVLESGSIAVCTWPKNLAQNWFSCPEDAAAGRTETPELAIFGQMARKHADVGRKVSRAHFYA